MKGLASGETLLRHHIGLDLRLCEHDYLQARMAFHEFPDEVDPLHFVIAKDNPVLDRIRDLCLLRTYEVQEDRVLESVNC